ncbi:hypothetical protein CHS0354_031066 [Potamilus streckersoni]|uniref:Immunoglobulin domain-containing protein n=1 Tax=Potamilus streckersoni TaxID=2493646 RepID=A0AAE0W1M3_9BIVA|nr:hypothetical protein CHS0354_031066 [Potamilus streckersoni]
MEQIILLFLLIIYSQNVKGLTWTPNSVSNITCENSAIYLIWSYTLDPGESVSVTEWKKGPVGGYTNVADDSFGFAAASGYTGRVTRIGAGGIKISSASVSDRGTYYIFVTIGSTIHTASATLTVYVNPNASCVPNGNIDGFKLIGSIPDACPVKGSSGTVWTVDAKDYNNEVRCLVGNFGFAYKCCAQGPEIATCYSGQSLCIQVTCPGNRIGAIIGITIGCLVIVLISGIVIYIKCIKTKGNGTKPGQQNGTESQGMHAAIDPKTLKSADPEAKLKTPINPSINRPLPLEPLNSQTAGNVNQPPNGGQLNLVKPKKKRKKQKEQKDKGSPAEEVKEREG